MAASTHLDSLESDVDLHEVRAHAAHDGAVRTQIAFVRALVDEIRRRSESDAITSSLLEQLDEEFARLTRLVRGSDSPDSAARLRC